MSASDDSRERREVIPIPAWCFEEAERLANTYEGFDYRTALARLVQQQCKPPVDEPWHTPLGGLIEARRVLQQAYRSIEVTRDQNTHIPGNPYHVALAALNPALGALASLVMDAGKPPVDDAVEALKRISAMCPATADMSVAHMMAAEADAALANAHASSVEPGK